jgi:glycosyltransferase involved in cell wall biosynthesis
VRRTATLPWHADYEVGSSRHKFAFDAYLGASVLRAVLKLRPDVVHGHLHEGALIGFPAARLTGVPLVFDYQGSLTGEMLDHGFIQPGSRATRFARWGEARINRLADRVITSSALAARQYALASGGRYATPVPDVVNTTVFRPDVLRPDERCAARAALGIPPDADVVVYLGLLAAYQGTDHLLSAAASVCALRPNAHFLIMGYPHVDRYRELARDHGLTGRVTFTGRVAYEDVPARLALGDVAVAPKLSATEGAGKLLTYMGMGLPTVAFDTPVSHEYLGDHGVYAATGDAHALALALTAVLDDPNRATRGLHLREHVTRAFPWEGMGRALEAVYASVIETRDWRLGTKDAQSPISNLQSPVSNLQSHAEERP